ncbi:PhzF family phenazine biosynthesis protein [Bacillus cereus]|uniref:PhzF family phenazine biosynthesis protein n=1 Tax=Bacillus cereus TaxID=1396 RepID=UPI002AC1B38D|nr:PhzF family phenazine biosynthesis protein [Bacillus cereus]MDZ4417308.1 PhzF family phenazine biosynthesis protein [Bacillus cereus]
MNCNGFYVFKMNAPDANILIHRRMFAPAIGINEAPVTGNAYGLLDVFYTP